MKYSRSRIYQYNKYDFRFQDFYHDSLNSMDTHKRRRNLSINRFSMFLLVNFEKSLLEVKTEIESCLHCIDINAEHYILKTILS